MIFSSIYLVNGIKLLKIPIDSIQCINSSLTFRSLIYFDVTFMQGVLKESVLIFFVCDLSVFPTPFVDGVILAHFQAIFIH